MLLFALLTEDRFSGKGLSWIKWIGLNSLYFMLIENPVKGFVVVVIEKLFRLPGGAVSGSLLWSAAAFGISVLGTAVAVKGIGIVKQSLRGQK